MTNMINKTERACDIEYTDAFRNVIGWAEHYDGCWHFNCCFEYADGLCHRLHEVQGNDLNVMDHVAMTCVAIAQAAGYI